MANRGYSATRIGLARLSTIERFPVGFDYPKSPVKRGLVMETVRNHQLGLTDELVERRR
jgi:hypothetical protein